MTNKSKIAVPDRLLSAAQECFLNDDYHKVSTRQIAEMANTNISMIRYYFGSKEGLYEEMVAQTLQPLLDVMETSLLSSTGGFSEYFQIYYKTMQDNPRFPALILKVLALQQAPGRRFVFQLLERGRERGRETIEKLKKNSAVSSNIDPDIVRISFVSLAMMPVLLKEVFENQLEYEMDGAFYERLALFNGQLFTTGLAPDS